jgi:2-methylcitrate dehydratase PrpD
MTPIHAPDASERLAAYIAATRFEDLPAPVVTAVKHGILDTLGCVLAGTGCADVERIRGVAQAWDERGTCTVLGTGGMKAAPMTAVLVNGSAIHQYDFDDTHDLGPCHPSSTSVIPAIAVAESLGGASGRDLIRAVAHGNEVTSRASLAVHGTVHDYPWFRAPVCGLFGATVAAACMRGATAAQLVEAFGLTLPMVGGTFASLAHHGSSVRSIRDGLMYRNGLLAAELAMAGVRGDRQVFEGPFGFFQAYFGGHYDPEVFAGALGERHESARVSLKPWPSIRHLHATLTAVIETMQHHRLAFDDIAFVDVSVGRINADRCRHLPARGADDDHIDLLHNLHFAVANAILHGELPLAVYRETARAQRVIDLGMPKVRSHRDPRQDGAWTFEPGHVAITTVAGVVHEGSCRIALGNPDHPMSDAQRHAKFAACARHAARPLDEARIARIVELVEGLERLERLAPLLEAMA